MEMGKSDPTKFDPARSVVLPAALLAALMVLPVSTMAEYNHGSIEQATVLSAEPVYRTVRINNPVEQCRDEKVHIPAPVSRSYTPPILGAIIGGAIGNEFGSGRGNDLATLAGAVLGGSVGRDYQSRQAHNHGRVVYEKRCEVVDRYTTVERIDGYDVTYRYDGRIYSTTTSRDPGQTIKVSVNVVPIE
jgi:uncharacterized protein YcfJ